jgi:Cytochrome c554 and c-prime
MRLARCIPVLLAGCVIAMLCRGDEPAGLRTNRSAEPGTGSRFRGAGSCSATACHGSIKAFDRSISNVSRNEHTTWMSSDAHSRAFQVLFDERSERIEGKLASSEGGYTKASEDLRCLACHTTPRPPSEMAVTAWLNSDGVSCESCHGASERYIGAHTTGAWKERDRREKEDEWGFRNTKDLTRRASICAGCHVGEHSRDGLTVRDVNHDLIAAGHPRLNFEFSAFLDNMPSHWEEKHENAGPVGSSGRAANFPARAWAIGRLTTINAALALLENRVAEADAPPEALVGHGSAATKRTARWPEFTEYACFSCHHDLRDQAWRRGPRSGGVALGAPRWGTWALPGAEELLAALVVDPDRQTASESLKRVAIAMKQPRAISQIKSAARDASGSIEKCLASVAAHGLDVATIERMIDRIDDPQAWNRVAGWDEAAQRYLALVPLYQSWLALAPDRTPKQEALRKRLAELLEALKFPKGVDSPRGFEPGRFPSQEP